MSGRQEETNSESLAMKGRIEIGQQLEPGYEARRLTK